MPSSSAVWPPGDPSWPLELSRPLFPPAITGIPKEDLVAAARTYAEAPAAHAAALASARAVLIRSKAASSIAARVRHAVGCDATVPNSSG